MQPQHNFCVYNTHTHTKHDTTILSVYMTSRNFILVYIFLNFGSQCERNFFLDLASKNLGMPNGPWNTAQHLASKHPQQGGSQRHKSALQ